MKRTWESIWKISKIKYNIGKYISVKWNFLFDFYNSQNNVNRIKICIFFYDNLYVINKSKFINL